MLTHAIMDALLGAAGLDDIGAHFPDTDERYKGADSIALLETVRDLITEAGYAVRSSWSARSADRASTRCATGWPPRSGSRPAT